jgi:hypothetical protein
MKFLNSFALAIVFSSLLIIGCTNSETNISTSEPETEKQIDTISSNDEAEDTIMTEKKDEKPGKKAPKNQVTVKNKTTKEPIKESTEKKDQTIVKTTANTESKASETYKFINANAGKQVEDDFKGDLMTLAAEEIYIEKKGKCADEYCGKKIILVNMNQNKSIDATVQISWKVNDKKNNKKRSYILNSSQKLEIGCSSLCDVDNTSVKWNIIGATYSK